jgi:predicted chitinase
MQLSDSLEVGIGLSFIFFLSSLVLASIHEMIETVLKARGKYLFDGICELFNDPARLADGERIAKVIYQHPLVRGLMQGDVSQPDFRKKLPSYLPTRNFVLALIDQAGRGELAPPDSLGKPAAAPPLQQLRLMAEGIENQQVRIALTHAIDTAEGDIDTLATNLEAWFDSAMDRVSGWYKRRSQRIIFVLGLFCAVALNVNTITIAQSLLTSSSVRHAVVALAQTRAKPCADPAACNDDKSVQAIVNDMDATGLPVGWAELARNALLKPTQDKAPIPALFAWLVIATGYLLTAFAVTLGAPFWFDVLNKLMVIRATVKPTEKSQDEASQDKQQDAGAGPIINVLPAVPVAHAEAGPPKAPPPDTDIFLSPPNAPQRLFEDDSGQPVAANPRPEPPAAEAAAADPAPAAAAAAPVAPPEPAPITADKLLRFSHRLPAPRAALYAAVLTEACAIAGLNSACRICNFLGQVGEETGGLASLTESTAYRNTEENAAFLAATFRNVHGLEHARRLLAAGPEAIGNTIYALKNGNGDIATGDGYRYRGRGFLQITGRGNYRKIGSLMNLPLEDEPERLGTPDVAAQAAARFWTLHRINVPADADDVGTVTQLVNGGARLHQAERQTWHDVAKGIWVF